MAITIEWLGHCAFRLIQSDGLSILIDPFDQTIGYKVPDYSCDILVVTHSHYDTAAVHMVPDGYELVDRKGTTLVNGIAFNAFPLNHADHHGRNYGTVLVFHFELEGIKIGYLSHIGEYPKSWVIERLGQLDICFLPVGGQFALGPNDAKFLVRELGPKYVIPMHFNTRHLNFTLLPVTEFTKAMPDIHEVDDWRIELDSIDLPFRPTVLLMQHWPGVDPY